MLGINVINFNLPKPKERTRRAENLPLKFGADTFVGSLSKNNHILLITEGNVSLSYADKIFETFKDIPSDVMQVLGKYNYSICVTDDIQSVCKKHNIITRSSMKPLGVTCYSPMTKENLIVFSDDIPDEFIGPVVNHEIGHALLKSLKLSSEKNCISALLQDVIDIRQNRKLDKMTQEECRLISTYFLNLNGKSQIDEIIADSIAWQKMGSGCYGSELTLEQKNCSLMSQLFPSLFQYLSNINLC